MKRLDIVQRVLNKPANARYTAKFIGQVFDEILEEISSTLENGEDVKITGLGTFIVRKINDRPGRNPKTGEPVMIPAHHTVLFHPSRSLVKDSGKTEKK
jgi:integration host factor subunit alpha|uniref:Integration host factor subunit alpha n=1 Tax=Leptospirillum ferriphilum TaxID=178606 RepID=A0A7C3QUX7_9BACT